MIKVWCLVLCISVTCCQHIEPFSKYCKEKRILPGDFTYPKELYNIECPQLKYSHTSAFKNNNNFTLLWVQSNDYNPKTEWQYYTKTFTDNINSRVHVNNNKLVFAYVEYEDKGTYVCLLKNETYCEYGVIIVQIEQDHLPFDEERVTMEGKTSILVCDVNSITVPDTKYTISWYKDSKKIKHSNITIIDKNTLTLVDTTTNDNGIFVCKIDTTYNKKVYSSVRNIMLYVKPITKPSAEIISPMGDIKSLANITIVINCTINTNELIKYASYRLYWKVNNRPVFVFSSKGIKQLSETYINDEIINLPLEIYTNDNAFTYQYTCHYEDLDYRENLQKTIKLIKI
ncbi:IL-1 beta-receptor [Hypsugopox virus]|nr:IL-1 beta-receptor [Hypsugopox virus]